MNNETEDEPKRDDNDDAANVTPPKSTRDFRRDLFCRDSPDRSALDAGDSVSVFE